MKFPICNENVSTGGVGLLTKKKFFSWTSPELGFKIYSVDLYSEIKYKPYDVKL